MGSFNYIFYNKLGQHNITRVFQNLYLFVITSISGFFFLFLKKRKKLEVGYHCKSMGCYHSIYYSLVRDSWCYCSTAFDMSKVLRGSTSYNTLIWTGFYSYRNIHEELDNNHNHNSSSSSKRSCMEITWQIQKEKEGAKKTGEWRVLCIIQSASNRQPRGAKERRPPNISVGRTHKNYLVSLAK